MAISRVDSLDFRDVLCLAIITISERNTVVIDHKNF